KTWLCESEELVDEWRDLQLASAGDGRLVMFREQFGSQVAVVDESGPALASGNSLSSGPILFMSCLPRSRHWVTCDSSTIEYFASHAHLIGRIEISVARRSYLRILGASVDEIEQLWVVVDVESYATSNTMCVVLSSSGELTYEAVLPMPPGHCSRAS